MSTMAIPPFPPLDLAKLVLGYLAEEQLMTAYDEFLQASPYLDALRNEYDRIFMTSLKNILAEYRAVKIYVETCKPFALRRKLFQCTNLLDVVKFLVNHIDVNKIQSQDTNSFRNCSDKINSSSRLNTCEVCESSKLTSCACKTRQTVSQVPATSIHSTSNSELAVRESSVEATALSDLPGNHVPTRKKLIKTLDKESSVPHFSSGSGLQDSSIKHSTSIFSNAVEEQNSVLSRHDMSQNIGVPPKVMDESQEKIKEFNDILHLVCTKNTSNMQQGNIDRRVSNAGTFQDFATGMIGSDKKNINVPDCSNSENVNIQVPNAKDKISSTSTKKTRRVKKSQILVVANVAEHLKQPSEVIDVDAIDDKHAPKIQLKVDQSKIKILSDVKVGNETLNNNLNTVLQNATSTPMLKMQTVVINGTPVYKPVTSFSHPNYTKDEIMAMPTIIVTPLSGPPPATVTAQPQQVTAPSQQATAPPPPVSGHHMPAFVPMSNSDPAPSLGPLVIEVSANNTYTLKKTIVPNEANLAEQKQADQGLITTVNSTNIVTTVTDTGKSTDAVSASVPKDNVIASGTETSTPQVLPPTRKSSSTPRRTSHVRVLDFTTPRRILHETINEVPNSNIAEVVLSKSPNVVIPNVNVVNDNVNIDVRDTDCQKQTSKENNNTNVAAKKKDWDSDLRALLGGSASNQNKIKPKTNRKKKVEVEPKHDDDKDVSSKKKTKPRKTKKDKNEMSTDSEKRDKDVSVPSKQKVDIPKKPTINIISGHDWEVSHQETERAQNKSSNDEQDTPELDRLCLEKAIGARLNISDLLETPYKQALYDIQMETPRFLGPDLPGDPPSDIKITNIPTPRFLSSPKGLQATPSYSSRPTDYSSGGSYYKPDDQDYMPLPEQIGYPASSSKENNNESPCGVNDVEQENGNKSKSSRPVRQCAKNVSYFKHQITKTKEDSTKRISDSIREDSMSDSSLEQSSLVKKKENSLKKLKENTPRIRPKSDKGRKSISKKYKSPLKKEVSKSFMKIRPRRSTPIKDSKGERSKKRASEIPTPLSKSQSKKRTTSKERNIHAIPAAVAVPTKSRRKSSTPRKLHCTKLFNSESSGHNSPDLINKDKHNDLPQEAELQCTQDSDTEQLKLRWSDDGSQDAKPKASQDNVANESEDISKIQEYIKTTICSKPTSESEGSLHIDLVKRGFDMETAKIIERDLLDTPPHPKTDTFVPQLLQSESKTEEAVLEKTIESESSISNNLQIVQDEQQDEEEEVEEIELSVHECDKDSDNFFTYCHDHNVDANKVEPVKLKDKFCMEVCIDDGVTIRLRATQCSTLFDLNPEDEKYDDPQDIEETQRAVSSIKFQTPLKDRIKAQCFEIFDSTLTSLDTPLKVDTPRRPDPEVTVTEIVLEVENVEMKEKTDCKKRKRVHSENVSDDSGGETKKSKSEPQYMLNSANIQNIDIESVLSKLHGP